MTKLESKLNRTKLSHKTGYYVYTALGEKYSEHLGIKNRKAGCTAFYGFSPLKPGLVADIWLANGWVEINENYKEE